MSKKDEDREAQTNRQDKTDGLTDRHFYLYYITIIIIALLTIWIKHTHHSLSLQGSQKRKLLF